MGGVNLSKQFYHHYFSLRDSETGLSFESHDPHFLLNNKALVIVNMEGSGVQDRMIGIDRSINEDDSGGFAPAFLGVTNNCPTFKMQIACLDKFTGQPLNLTPKELFDLNKHLFKDYYQELKIYGAVYGTNDMDEQKQTWTDLIYYVICLRATQYNINAGKGYIEVEFRLDSPCAYSPQQEKKETIQNGYGTFEVEAAFNVGNYIYPDIEFILPNGSGNVSIRNANTGETMTFVNVPQNNKIYCYNEGYKYVQNQTDTKAYAMGMLDPNSVWLSLVDGENLIEVAIEGTDRMEVRFLYQNKIAIQ